jgi:hypothetical protein
MTKIKVKIQVIMTLKKKSRNMFKLRLNFLKERTKEW